MRTRVLVPSLFVLTLVAAGCANDDAATTGKLDAAEQKQVGTDQPLLAVAEDNGNFTTLVAAVEAAGLDDALAGDGPFTLFAPADEAFFDLGLDTIDRLLSDPTGDLADVLQLHVIEGAVPSGDAMTLLDQCVETLGGDQLRIELDREALTVGGAIVVDADVQAGNGVIHVIDRVITAPSEDC